MIIVVDVGNTNITVGMFCQEKIVGHYRMTTQMARTSDEYGVLLRDFLGDAGFKAEDVEDVVIASVVPSIMYSLNHAIKKYFHVTPIVVGPGIKTGIKIGAENPKEVGADLIVDAVAVKELYGGPAIVIDFGTATTYELVLSDGTLDSVVICPGIRISAQALFNGTAKIPNIEIRKPKTILGKETTVCLQAGLFYGTIGQVEYIVDKMIEESGLKDVKVIATGGLGRIIANETTKIQVYDNMLTLQGLRLIRKRCRGL
ncbi:type III pantothenate kinase [Catenibacillus scindens]|uniref:Type III pantothenate kinase n=1 Tax=Catenibacillus scindens TaxID=673271 RepID=A0A7W8H7K4_9FIRM|nr:type III pantothenate kinase [Catenibacillus scindens]MBB5262983.1 type III pantothenate kinase [Catenibacillus scindens]